MLFTERASAFDQNASCLQLVHHAIRTQKSRIALHAN